MLQTNHKDFFSYINELDKTYIEPLNHLAMIHLSGVQAVDFLQGQITSDVIGLNENEWTWSAQCDAKGKMFSSFRLMRQDDNLFLIMHRSLVEKQIEHFKKYAVFHKVTIELSDQHLFGIYGKDYKALLTEQFGDSNEHVIHTKGITALKGSHGAILCIAPHAKNPYPDLPNNSLWQAFDIKAGYPVFENIHQEKYIPQMMNLHALNGISFTKGCYIGQETIARMTYRGGIKRSLYILEGFSEQNIKVGDSLDIKLEKGFKRSGEIIQVHKENNHYLVTSVMAAGYQGNETFCLNQTEQDKFYISALPYPLDK